MAFEPILFLPPILCDARVFAPQIDDLSRDQPAMFAPVCAGERIEEIASQILGAAPTRFAMVGMGLGGAVALEIVRRAPERVLRLALINATHHGETPEAASAREPLIVAARSGRFADVIAEEGPHGALGLDADRVTLTALVEHMAHGLGPERYVRQARAMQRRRDQQATLRKIKQPTLIMCGAQDGTMPIKRQEFMAELIPTGRICVVEGAGSLPPLEQPQAVTDHLKDWLGWRA